MTFHLVGGVEGPGLERAGGEAQQAASKAAEFIHGGWLDWHPHGLTG